MPNYTNAPRSVFVDFNVDHRRLIAHFWALSRTSPYIHSYLGRFKPTASNYPVPCTTSEPRLAWQGHAAMRIFVDRGEAPGVRKQRFETF